MCKVSRPSGKRR